MYRQLKIGHCYNIGPSFPSVIYGGTYQMYHDQFIGTDDDVESIYMGYCVPTWYMFHLFYDCYNKNVNALGTDIFKETSGINELNIPEYVDIQEAMKACVGHIAKYRGGSCVPLDYGFEPTNLLGYLPNPLMKQTTFKEMIESDMAPECFLLISPDSSFILVFLSFGQPGGKTYALRNIRELVFPDIQSISYFMATGCDHVRLKFEDIQRFYSEFTVYVYDGTWQSDKGIVVSDIHGNCICAPML